MGSLSRGTKADQFSYVPAGTVLPFAGAVAPDGWALCDGSTVSRTDYAELYMAIGDAWGNGDGSTTFHLPDMRGRFMRGVDAGAGRDADSGDRTPSNTGGNSADAVGSAQDDAMQRLTGDVSLYSTYVSGPYTNKSGVFNDTYNSGAGAHFGSGNVNYPYITFDNADSTSPNLAKTSQTETRGKNVNMNYIIKL